MMALIRTFIFTQFNFLHTTMSKLLGITKTLNPLSNMLSRLQELTRKIKAQMLPPRIFASPKLSLITRCNSKVVN